MSFKVVVTFCIATSKERAFLLLHILTNFWCVTVLDVGCSSYYVILPHYCFTFQFPNDIWCWTLLHMLVCQMYIFFGELLIQIFCSFFNWVFHFHWPLRILYVFKINFYWSRVDLQCCVSFCCTASELVIYIYIYPLFF